MKSTYFKKLRNVFQFTACQFFKCNEIFHENFIQNNFDLIKILTFITKSIVNIHPYAANYTLLAMLKYY